VYWYALVVSNLINNEFELLNAPEIHTKMLVGRFRRPYAKADNYAKLYVKKNDLQHNTKLQHFVQKN